MDDKSLDRAAQRAQQYWFTDGIGELVVGGVFLFVALYFGAQAVLPEDSFLGSMLPAAMLLVVVGGWLLARNLIHTLKARLTYPRTGYVAFRQPDKKRRWITLLFAMGMAMLVSALFARAPASLAWIPAISGLLIGVYWLYYANRLGLVRFYVLAAVSAIAGAAITLAGLGESRGLPLYYAIIGLALLVSGGITLRFYLRQAPVKPAESEESI